MKKLSVYLDTSVVNFLYTDDAPDFQRVTVDFFAYYAETYMLYGSDVLLKELHNDPDKERLNKHLAVLQRYSVSILPRTSDREISILADAYMDQKIVPVRKRDDALHVAYATVFDMDVLLSWNFKHLANIRREARFAAVNQSLGYWKTLRIVSPLEVQDEEG